MEFAVGQLGNPGSRPRKKSPCQATVGRHLKRISAHASPIPHELACFPTIDLVARNTAVGHGLGALVPRDVDPLRFGVGIDPSVQGKALPELPETRAVPVDHEHTPLPPVREDYAVSEGGDERLGVVGSLLK